MYQILRESRLFDTGASLRDKLCATKFNEKRCPRAIEFGLGNYSLFWQQKTTRAHLLESKAHYALIMYVRIRFRIIFHPYLLGMRARGALRSIERN